MAPSYLCYIYLCYIYLYSAVQPHRGNRTLNEDDDDLYIASYIYFFLLGKLHFFF